ncbi:unnamed protein product [Gemmataceae bacterium]|nr:unnamed protein product [Gemmataceae bacterium]VTU02460.1 unnamed protein product [Gemmataceae bacterium]
MLTVALLILSADLRPIDLGALSLERAHTLDGRTVTVTLLVQKPAYSLLGRTAIGAADRDDGSERGAVLLGRRLDVREGERLVVRGRLDVIRHRADVVNGTVVPAWIEIRVTEAR